MTITAITPQLKVTMLKHLVAGKDLDFVATITRVPRDQVLDIVSAHGYPDVDKMAWAVDILTKTVGKIPERPADHRPHVLLDEPAKPYQSAPSGHVNIPPGIADLLHQGKASPWIRTQNLAAKIHTLLDDLTTRLADEQAAVEAKARVAHENALVASRIATLQAEIDKLKRKPAKAATVGIVSTPRESSRKYGLHPGVYSCTDPGCDRTFDTPQGAATHRRRAHEGFNPTRKAIA
jgi:hypothetical protein